MPIDYPFRVVEDSCMLQSFTYLWLSVLIILVSYQHSQKVQHFTPPSIAVQYIFVNWATNYISPTGFHPVDRLLLSHCRVSVADPIMIYNVWNYDSFYDRIQYICTFQKKTTNEWFGKMEAQKVVSTFSQASFGNQLNRFCWA